MYLDDRNMVSNTILKYANSSSNYYFIITVFLKIKKFRILEVRSALVEANNNREAVVICVRYVMKQPS